MARCNFWSSVSVFLYLTIPFATPLSFNFSPIEPRHQNTDITVKGDAYISAEGLQVTTDESNKAAGGQTGRATYKEPLHLWDKASGILTDFSTHFSFVIDANGSACPSGADGADGLAFFLAPVGSSIPADSAGSGLGLAYYNATANKSGDPFVAVEFDTYTNDWDPYGLHVGIDVDSLISATNATWLNNVTEGKKNDALISYNSTSKNLSVIFTGHMGNLTRYGRLDYTVDLRKHLPEWVSIGFSAATGLCFEKNNVKSWEFNSTLEMETVTPPINRRSSSMTRGRSHNSVPAPCYTNVRTHIIPNPCVAEPL